MSRRADIGFHNRFTLFFFAMIYSFPRDALILASALVSSIAPFFT